jgi:signal transduction histidine kinase
MKIRHKLTFYFSLACTLIILVFGISVYFFSAQHRKNEFFQRLKTRVEIAEKIFLEREAFSEEDYDKIRRQFLNSLPDETEEVVELNEGWQQKLTYRYPDDFLETLLEQEEAYFYNDTIQGAGRIFHLREGNYAVMITAVDKVGMRVLSNLRTIVVLAMLVCIFVISILSHYISRTLMLPIARKIQKANTISVSNLHERLNVFNPDDELGQLAISFNNLLDRLERSFDMQKLFVANASHELRNPLTAILGEAEVALEKERTSRDYQESLKNISMEADRLNLLVNNLLQLSAVSYNPSEIVKRDELRVSDLIFEALKKFELLDPLNQLQLIGYDASTEADRFVLGNRNLLVTALINVFDNASKFSSNGPVEVTVTSNEETVTISVKDKGVGISKEDIPKITQPFFRADNVRQIRGTGIGIPLTVRILELHQGSLQVESELNQGTTVRITLPLMINRES